MPGLGETEKEIRKLRKKLRQIENLERLEYDGRELTEDEEAKVNKKEEIRSRLREILAVFAAQVQQEDEADITADLTVCSDGDDSSTTSPVSSQACTPVHQVETVGRPSKPERQQAQQSVPISGRHQPHKLTEAEEPVEWSIVKSKKAATARPAEMPEHSDDNPQTHKKENRKRSPEKRISSDTGRLPGPAPPQEPAVKQRRPLSSEKVLSEEERTLLKERQAWMSREYVVLNLEGHNDLVGAVYLDKEYLLSGSRDTTVKVWNVQNGFEEKSFGGHTDAVTALLLLTECSSEKFTATFELPERDRLIVSGSLDCSVKLWSLKAGTLCRSMYTYNPVTALAFLEVAGLVVTGSGGGKVELWDPQTGNCIQSLTSHEDAVTELQTDGSYVYSTSVDGIVKVYQLRQKELHTVHVSDEVSCSTGSPLLLRHVRSMATSCDLVYYGDDGTNVKVLDWKKGMVHKLKNHTGEFGSTDAMCCTDSVLLTSGYDLDVGVGYMNVRSLPSEEYIGTLQDNTLPRIMCMSSAYAPNSRGVMIATGGCELRLWLPHTRSSASGHTVRLAFLSAFAETPEDSDLDSEAELSESDAEGPSSMFFWRSTSRRRAAEDMEDENEGGGWLPSWCTLV